MYLHHLRLSTARASKPKTVYKRKQGWLVLFFWLCTLPSNCQFAQVHCGLLFTRLDLILPKRCTSTHPGRWTNSRQTLQYLFILIHIFLRVNHIAPDAEQILAQHFPVQCLQGRCNRATRRIVGKKYRPVQPLGWRWWSVPQKVKQVDNWNMFPYFTHGPSNRPISILLHTHTCINNDNPATFLLCTNEA